MSSCGSCGGQLNMLGLCTVCEPEGTDRAIEGMVFSAISLCNAHRWSYGGPDTLRALAEAVAA